MMSFLEVRVPISPTPHFFRRVHYLAASFKAAGGRIADYSMIVSVGADQEPTNLYREQPWSRKYPIEWRWVDRRLFAKHSYFATGRDRHAYQARARYVMFADADILVIRNFEELLDEIERRPAISGVIAHGSPFVRNADGMTWAALFDRLGKRPPEMCFEHTGWGFMGNDPNHRYAPPYFNFGVVLGTADMVNMLAKEFPGAEDSVNAVFPGYFRAQIALTVAISRLGLPARAIPLRYNFPNDSRFERGYPEDLANVSILHYLRRNVVHCDRDFDSSKAIRQLLARPDLTGANEILRARLAKLYPAVLTAEEGPGFLRHWRSLQSASSRWLRWPSASA